MRPMSTSRYEMTRFQKRPSPVGLFDLDKAKIGDKTIVMLFTAKWCQPCEVLMSWIESSPHIADDKVGQYS